MITNLENVLNVYTNFISKNKEMLSKIVKIISNK